MGFDNPPISWSEFERKLSGRRPARPVVPDVLDDGPGSRKRQPVQAQRIETETGPRVPYAELHVHSDYSFLDGASTPEQLVVEALRLRLDAIALTDHDGFYGAVQLAEAADAYRDETAGHRPLLGTVFGAELSLGLTGPQNGVADPEGQHLLVLARKAEGYHALAGAITEAQLAPGAQKGSPVYAPDALAAALRGSVVVLTGCRKGAVRQALLAAGRDAAGARDAAGRELDRLVEGFGADAVLVELFDHGDPLASAHNDALAELARRRGLGVVATNNVHFARPQDNRLATAVAAVRARRSLDEIDGWLPAAGRAHLRSGAEMAALFRRHPGAVESTVDVASDLAFELRSVKPGLPRRKVPEGHTSMSWLRELVRREAPSRFAERMSDAVWARLERELDVIEEKDFPGYFLIVHDIVQFATGRGILNQGRGSAANSAVCFALGITAVDPVFFNLPFERFLSTMRDEEPDIDVDFDSRRREEVIQYVFDTYGRRNAAQVANVISYRPKAAIRDMAKALGASPGQQDAWTKQVERWGPGDLSGQEHDIPDAVVELAEQLMRAPRHLGIHSGGMVLTERPVGEIVPIENARKAGRTVLQWDKGDIEWMGLVKFDLLGLGMLEALQYIFELVRDRVGEEWTLATLPKEERAVYDMLCRGDAIGVFQVESRAQLGTLPRLRPRRLYDLVVEVALIRPGPIQGGAVHPYIRRRTGEEDISYLHPELEPVLRRTLGVPLFQEQVMQMAMVVGGCTPEDADLLRRAMGSKRGQEKIATLQRKLFAGMASHGITGELAWDIYEKIEAFASFGFAESHAQSFALLVYASSWLKLHHPAAFLAGLLRAQPMGFYAPRTLTADAVRHGVEVRGVDLARSNVHADLEPLDEASAGPRPPVTGLPRCRHDNSDYSGHPDAVDEASPFDEMAPDAGPVHRRDGAWAVRLGLAGVKTIGEGLAQRIVDEREAGGPYADPHDLARRVGLTTPQLEALAAAGAFDALGLSRREAMWQAGPASRERPGQLPGTALVVQPPLLPIMSAHEQLVYDLWATGISPGDHPLRHARARLEAEGVLSVRQLSTADPERRILVGGVVTHRQRPSTAGGVTFLSLEDETGLANVIVSEGVWKHYRRIAREAPAMIVRGILERSPEGVVSVLADRLELLPLAAPTRSRDFQ